LARGECVSNEQLPRCPFLPRSSPSDWLANSRKIHGFKTLESLKKHAAGAHGPRPSLAQPGIAEAAYAPLFQTSQTQLRLQMCHTGLLLVVQPTVASTEQSGADGGDERLKQSGCCCQIMTMNDDHAFHSCSQSATGSSVFFVFHALPQRFPDMSWEGRFVYIRWKTNGCGTDRQRGTGRCIPRGAGL
jgi:hypothetical protein